VGFDGGFGERGRHCGGNLGNAERCLGVVGNGEVRFELVGAGFGCQSGAFGGEFEVDSVGFGALLDGSLGFGFGVWVDLGMAVVMRSHLGSGDGGGGASAKKGFKIL
jgi:hypothetical protein